MARFVIDSQPQKSGGRFVIEEQPDPKAYLDEPAVDPLGKMLGLSVGQSQGFGNNLANGLTFGMGAEIAGAANDIKRAIGLSDRETADVIRDWDRIRTDYADKEPLSAAAGEIVGAGPTLLVPGLGGARVAQGARAGLRPALREGLRLGARYGVVSIPGRADISPDDTAGEAAGKLATSAVREPLMNAAGGALGAGVGQVIGKGYDVVRRTVANNLTGRRSAETAFNKSLQESGTSAGDMLNDLLPTHRSLQAPQVEEAFTVLGDAMRRHNGNQRAALQDATARLAQTWNTTPATARNRLSRLMERYQGRDSPLVLAEQPGSSAALREARANPNATDADMMRFNDDQARQTIDYLANTPGRARSEVRTQLGQRLASQGQRLRQVLTGAVGGQDFETLANQLDQALINQGRAGYQAAFAAERQAVAANGGRNPLVPRLERTLDRFRRIYVGGRSGAVQEAVGRALDEFYHGVQVQGQNAVRNVVPDLQNAIDARAALRDMIDGLGPQDRTVRAALTRLYNRVTVDMRRTYPDWWRANQVWGDVRTGERAMEFILSMPRTPGVRQNRVLDQFDRLPQHQQDRARVAYVQKLHNEMGGNDSGDMLKWAKSENGRRVLRRIFGDQEADRLLLRLREFDQARSTAQMVGGSQTASRLATRETMDAPLELAGQADALSLGGIRRAVTQYGIQRAKDRRNVPLGRIAMTPMDRPEQVIPQLRRLQQAQARSQPNLQGRGDLARRLAQALIVGNQGGRR